MKGKILIIFAMETEKEKKGNIYGVLAIAYALIQYLWAVVITVYYRRSGMLEYVTSPDGYIPLFFANLTLSVPMLLVFLGAFARYRRHFGTEMDYVKTDRYALTLILTTIYTFMLPLSVVLSEVPTKGAYAWFYYIFFIAFFEEFLYRGLVPNLMERSNFPKWLKFTLPALLYGLYQTALPLGRSGLNISVFISALPDIIFSLVMHNVLLSAKKWSGAMWLPIIIHAILELALYLLFA